MDDKDSMMPLIIFLEDSNYKEEDPRESPSKTTSEEPTPEPGSPSEKPTEETTLETYYDSISEPSAPTREGSMGYLSPRDTVRQQKEPNPPLFATLEEHTKEDPWEDTCKIRILGQGKSLEVGEYLLTPNENPSQITTQL